MLSSTEFHNHSSNGVFCSFSSFPHTSLSFFGLSYVSITLTPSFNVVCGSCHFTTVCTLSTHLILLQVCKSPLVYFELFLMYFPTDLSLMLLQDSIDSVFCDSVVRLLHNSIIVFATFLLIINVK